MNEIKNVLIGMDFGEKTSQLTYYNRRLRDAISFTPIAGSSQFDFATMLARRAGRKDWNIGREAEFFSKKENTLFFESLYEITASDELIHAPQETFQPWELLAFFFQEALKMLGIMHPKGQIKQFVITMQEVRGYAAQNISRACKSLGLSETQFSLQSYPESFYYHTINQKRELWARNVAWYHFEGAKVTFCSLYSDQGASTVIYKMTQELTTQLPLNETNRDVEFYKFVQECMRTDIYSCIFITGVGFSAAWATKSVAFLCRQQRKVFFVENLFAKGACYAAREVLEERKFSGQLYAGKGIISRSISMDMRVNGEHKMYPIVPAGIHWYDCDFTFRLILDDAQAIVFETARIKDAEKSRIKMPLPDLPKRPNKTTRLEVSFKGSSDKECMIQVKDLGFGDFYPATQKIWTETILW
ncbi:MAG: DUF5716 family protein [Lachnospiraceae bacterium]